MNRESGSVLRPSPIVKEDKEGRQPFAGTRLTSFSHGLSWRLAHDVPNMLASSPRCHAVLPPACSLCLQTLGMRTLESGSTLAVGYNRLHFASKCVVHCTTSALGWSRNQHQLATTWKINRVACKTSRFNSGYPRQHHFWKQFRRATPSYLLKFAWRGFLMALMPLPEHCWAARNLDAEGTFFKGSLQLMAAKQNTTY